MSDVVRKTVLVIGVILIAFSGYRYWLETTSIAALPEVPEIDQTNFFPHVKKIMEVAYAGVRKEPLDENAAARLGALLHSYDFPDAAAVAYQRAVMLDPDNYQTTYLLAIVNLQSGHQDAGIDGLERVLTLSKNSYTPATLKLSEELLDRGELDRAEILLTEILDVPDYAAWSSYRYGQLLSRRDDFSAALNQFNVALSHFDKFGSAHYEVALIYAQSGDEEQSQRHMDLYNKYKEARPPRPDPLLFAVAALNVNPVSITERGLAYAALGQSDQAIREFNKALKYQPDYSVALLWLIREYAKVGRHDDAKQSYVRALESVPGWSEAHIQYGAALQADGRYDLAIEPFTQAIASNPFSVYAHLQRGVSYEKSDNNLLATNDYRRALELEPNNQRALGLLANQLIKSGALDEAKTHLLLATQEQSEQTVTLEVMLATLYEKTGEYELSQQYFEQALSNAKRYGRNEIAQGLQQKLEQMRREGQ